MKKRRELFLQEIRNGQRAMTRRRQQPEEMEWSLEKPNLKKRCLARELWQQP
jgi:hypothetical protein